MRTFHPPEDLYKVELPEKRKLPQFLKTYVVPDINVKAKASQLKLIEMRGTEEVHNTLNYNQFGVQALAGGELHYKHLEMIRAIVNKSIDERRMFAVWRVDQPSVGRTKKAVGVTLGGGKGSAHHFVTRVKAERIILELGGNLHETEAFRILNKFVGVMPMKCRVVSPEVIADTKRRDAELAMSNRCPFNWEYFVRNNMQDCHRFISTYDHLWLGKNVYR